ncbi:MAG: AMP-binding protein, partial [Thermomicrobiales bacterium]|nr:AMP-binding protein [Thermomicrobiales bacterium]
MTTTSTSSKINHTQDASESDEAVAWEPSAPYLERSRTRRFMAHHDIPDYDELLARAVADPAWYWGAVAEDLELVWSTPYRDVLDLAPGAPWAEWFTGGGFNYVANALDRHAEATPDRVAIIWEGDDGAVRRLTFGELLAETNRLANTLRELGVQRGDRIGVFLPMLPETVTAVLALGKLGAVFLPMFSGFGADALGSRLRDGEATLLITSDEALRRGKAVPMKAVADEAMAMAPSVRTCLVLWRTGGATPWTPGRDVWWHEVVPEQSTEFATVETAANEPYMIIYTSGTTGRPKGAMLDHGNMVAQSITCIRAMNVFREDDVAFMTAPLFHIAGWGSLAPNLMLGIRTVIHPLGGFDPGALLDAYEKEGATTAFNVPEQWKALCAHPDATSKGRKLRIISWGAAPASLTLLQKMGETFPNALNVAVFGQTEMSPITCVLRGDDSARKIGSVGLPVPTIQYRVVDDAMNDVSRGEVGEIIYRGPTLMQGYWRKPAETADAFEGGWFHSGDLVR